MTTKHIVMHRGKSVKFFPKKITITSDPTIVGYLDRESDATQFNTADEAIKKCIAYGFSLIEVVIKEV